MNKQNCNKSANAALKLQFLKWQIAEVTSTVKGGWQGAPPWMAGVGICLQEPCLLP